MLRSDGWSNIRHILQVPEKYLSSLIPFAHVSTTLNTPSCESSGSYQIRQSLLYPEVPDSYVLLGKAITATWMLRRLHWSHEGWNGGMTNAYGQDTTRKSAGTVHLRAVRWPASSTDRRAPLAWNAGCVQLFVYCAMHGQPWCGRQHDRYQRINTGLGHHTNGGQELIPAPGQLVKYRYHLPLASADAFQALLPSMVAVWRVSVAPHAQPSGLAGTGYAYYKYVLKLKSRA